MIACIQQGYEELEGEYKSIIDYMDHYIEEISPLYIRKCQVPNKGGRRGTWFLSSHFYFLICLMSNTIHYLISQVHMQNA